MSISGVHRFSEENLLPLEDWFFLIQAEIGQVHFVRHCWQIVEPFSGNLCLTSAWILQAPRKTRTIPANLERIALEIQKVYVESVPSLYTTSCLLCTNAGGKKNPCATLERKIWSHVIRVRNVPDKHERVANSDIKTVLCMGIFHFQQSASTHLTTVDTNVSCILYNCFFVCLFVCFCLFSCFLFVCLFVCFLFFVFFCFLLSC